MTMSLFVQITVKDFDEWKKVADSGAELIKEHGVIASAIHRNPENPNSVMIHHQFADQDTLNAFLGLMERSQDVFEAAGVVTTELWYGQDVT